MWGAQLEEGDAAPAGNGQDHQSITGWRDFIPFIKSLILPEIGNFTKNLMDDISQNISPKQSIKSNLKKSVKNNGKKIIRGGNVM